jgi:hypothetical protein
MISIFLRVLNRLNDRLFLNCKKALLLQMIRICTIPLLLILMAFALPKLIKTKLQQGITVSLPPELKPMSPEDIAQRFPSVRAPLGAFTSDERLVDFSVNISATQWPDSDLKVAEKFFKAGIYNMYDHIEVISEGIYEVHHRKYIFLEFESRLNGGRMKEGYQSSILHYTFIQYLVEPKRSLVFSFHCPQDQREQWQPIAHAVMKSVTIK